MKTKAPGNVLRISLIVLILSVAAYAYGSQGEGNDSTYSTFNTGGLQFKIDNRAYYNGSSVPSSTWILKDLVPGTDKFFNFSDVKPGDYGRSIISLHVKKSSAWVCLDFSKLKDLENSVNEPESLADTNGTASGELGKGMEFFAWFDGNGNTIFDVGEKPLFGTTTQSAIQTLKDKTYALADYKNGPAWKKDSTHYIGIAWCAGNLNVNLATALITCDATTMENEAQTDSLSVDVSLRAVTSGDNAKFLCGGGKKEKEKEKEKEKDKDKDRDDEREDGYNGKGDHGGSICRPGDKRRDS